MGTHVLRCAAMRGPLKQPARQHAVRHLWWLTGRSLPNSVPTATASMHAADGIASIGPIKNQHGLQLPTDLARLIHHNLVMTGRENVLVV